MLFYPDWWTLSQNLADPIINQQGPQALVVSVTHQMWHCAGATVLNGNQNADKNRALYTHDREAPKQKLTEELHNILGKREKIIRISGHCGNQQYIRNITEKMGTLSDAPDPFTAMTNNPKYFNTKAFINVMVTWGCAGKTPWNAFMWHIKIHSVGQVQIYDDDQFPYNYQ